MNQIMIRPLARGSGEYMAYFKHKFLRSCFAITFDDSIRGALALHHFIEMLREQFTKLDFELNLSDKELCFKNQALRDTLSTGGRRQRCS